MGMRPFRVVFTLDPAGVVYSPQDPIHLDGLLAWCCKRHHAHGRAPARDEPPDEIPLPLERWHCGGTWGWCASALLPEESAMEALGFWYKRLRRDRVGLVAVGTPNTAMGIYRDWAMPLPRQLVTALVAYGVGDLYEVRRELRRHVRALGAKRRQGHGRVVNIEVVPWPENWSLVREGRAQRWLPAPDGPRLVRPRPPYWSVVDRVRCVEVGSPWEKREDSAPSTPR